jgi:NAD(P)-dependent dehydrogenase (short-subunit alcohol dehydrogenase family)
MRVDSKVVVVTGAGSGIGKALVNTLSAQGAAIAACDIDLRAAEETIAGLLSTGPRSSHPFRVDVADEASWAELHDQVLGHFGRVDGLVNNAGVLGQVAPVDVLTTQELRWVLDIDLWGVIFGTRTFLPDLKARNEAILVNVSSLAGLMGSLGNSAYFAAKFAVRGFSEAVRSELQRTNVTVTIVFPGIVRTNLGASHPGYSAEERAEAIRRYNAQPGVSPDHAAEKIARGIEKRKSRVLIGPDVWAIDKLVRLAPGNTDRVLHSFVAKMANKQRPDGKPVFR